VSFAPSSAPDGHNIVDLTAERLRRRPNDVETPRQSGSNLQADPTGQQSVFYVFTAWPAGGRDMVGG
jgi:hypothetical protein